MSSIATTKMSSRGQVVIPEKIRERLNLKPGTEFVIIAKGDVVLFKKVSPPSWEQFDALIREGRRQARLSALTPAVLNQAVARAPQMRVVLDTNVFVSGVFFSGPPSRILKAWRDGRLTLIYSAAIFEEYDRVFTELTEDFPRINPRPILDFLVIYGEIVHPSNVTITACRDPTDDKFIQCLLASKADCLISGDRDLLDGKFEDCSVFSPRQFCDRYL
jgi:uncharacterized protein